MKLERQLELQAYLDGELSSRAARRVAEWLGRDPEAQALAAELRMTKRLLVDNEPEVTVPESGEFYWSRIWRAIEAGGTRPPERAHALRWLFGWRRLFVPLSGVALALVLALGLIRTGMQEQPFQFLTEVENLSEHTVSHSFRSGNIFVVWIENRNDTQEAAPWEFHEELDDVIVQ